MCEAEKAPLHARGKNYGRKAVTSLPLKFSALYL